MDEKIPHQEPTKREEHTFLYAYAWQSDDERNRALQLLREAEEAIYCRQPEEDMELARLRAVLVRLPDCPPSYLAKLANHEDPALVERIAEHKNTPQAILSRLAKHEAPEVRMAVAENEATPLECLKELAVDASPDVRYRLAENHRSSRELLYLLMEDENPYVAHRARKTLHNLNLGGLIMEKGVWSSRPDRKRRSGSN